MQATQPTSLDPSTSPVPYTVFTNRQKRFLVFLLSLANLASPLAATIYLPLLPLLQINFHTSVHAIDLTITLYLVFQALSPMLFAAISDSLGRRPIFLITLMLYTLASLGLAVNKHSYAALLILRALQSLGASAILAVTYGVVADVCVPAERGKMQGPIIGMSNLGVNVGPLLGGLLAFKSGDFVWAFWGLVVFGGASLLVLGSLFPETARNVVGNGDKDVRAWWARTWWAVVKARADIGTKPTEKGRDVVNNNTEAMAEDGTMSHEAKESPISTKLILKYMNPWTAIQIMFWKDTALVPWMAASPYATYYCIQTSIPIIYKDVYQFNELQTGLSYLTGGAGVVAGGYFNGKLMDRNYALTAKEIGHEVDRVAGDDLTHFPIERARGRSCWYLLAFLTGGLVGYGWPIEKHVHVSIPLILQFVHGIFCTCNLQTFNALLVDIFPEHPSTAATSGNITRCALSAVYVALLQPLVEVLGRGWYFTLLGLVSGFSRWVAVWLLQARGPNWRAKRRKANDDNRNLQNQATYPEEGEQANTQATNDIRATGSRNAETVCLNRLYEPVPR